MSLRLCRPGTPVRESGPTNRPHVLVVFRPELVRPLELNRGPYPDALTIVLEYDNKGYMNTGGQLCYTGIKG